MRLGANESPKKVSLFGLEIYRLGVESLVDDLIGVLERSERAAVLAVNPHSIEEAFCEPAFMHALKKADFLFADGIGLVGASYVMQPKRRIVNRIAGFELFTALNERLNQRNDTSVAFVGSTETVLEMMRMRFQIECPNVRVAGIISPPFVHRLAGEESDAIVRQLQALKPTVVWVGLTAPKQEIWIAAVQGALSSPIVCGVGAVFDFYAGTVSRPSAAWRRLGVEWLVRLLGEPRRLWRRTLVSAPKFVFRMISEICRDRGIDGPPGKSGR